MGLIILLGPFKGEQAAEVETGAEEETETGTEGETEAPPEPREKQIVMWLQKLKERLKKVKVKKLEERVKPKQQWEVKKNLRNLQVDKNNA